MPTTRCLPILPALCALLLIPAIATAQACTGLPPDDRSFSVAFEGTDGHVGRGLDASFGFRDGGGMAFAFRDMERGRRVIRGEMAMETGDFSFPFCVTAGAWWVDQDADASRWTAAGVSAWRIPIGVAAGHRFESGGPHALTVFVNPALVFARTVHQLGGSRAEEPVYNVVPGGSFGLALSVGNLMLRGVVRHSFVPRPIWPRQYDFPYLSLQLGWEF